MSLIAEKSRLSGDRLVDITERVFLVLLASSCLYRLAPTLISHPQNLLVLISEGLTIVFILMRRPARRTDISPYATLIAFLGTALPLLVMASGRALAPVLPCAALMAFGIIFNISAKMALNTSFGLAAANRGVKRTGPYRLMRHPIYAGYVTTQAAFLLLNPCAWNIVIYAVGWTMQVLRIGAEERVLMEDPEYRAYSAKVRFRLAPGLY